MKINLTNWARNGSSFIITGVMTVAMLMTSCAEDEIFSEEELASIEVGKLATPTAGKIYTLKNRNSGRYMDVSGKSNSNGANIQQWGTSASSSDTHRQWEVISTGGSYYRLKGVDSGKSIEVANGSNTNGTNINQRAYSGATHQQWQILSVGDGYFRLKSRDSGKSIGVANGSTSNGGNVESRSWNGDDKFQWFFEEVGTSSGGGGNSGSDYPGDLIGLTTSNWKLNGFTGSPSSSTYRDDVLSSTGKTFSNYSDDNYFYSDGTYANFKVYRGQPSSSGSGNPRVELRELSGGSLAAWSGSSGTHTMEWTARVDQLGKDADGSGGVTCFGQIHGDGSTVDDVIRVQFIGSTNQSSGSVSLKVSGYVTEELQGGSKTYSGYSLDTDYNFKLTYSGSTVKFYVNGSEKFSQSMSGEDTSNNYFKVGNYMQSVQGASYDGSYALVRVKSLSISH